jgi:hypothetical protein
LRFKMGIRDKDNTGMTDKELAPQGGQTKIEVRLEGETLWLSPTDLDRLYQATRQNITIHVQNIYEEGELSEEATVKEYLQVQNEGGRKIVWKRKMRVEKEK